MIYDVGAHRGEDSEFYLKLGYRVVAVEADPDLAAALRSRFAAEIRNGALTLVQKAVADREGTIDFFANRKVTVWGTTRPDWAARNERVAAPSQRMQVGAVTFERLLREHGIPHYLKIDIEGADMLCIAALESLPGRPDYVSLEAAEHSFSAVREQVAALERLGYQRFRLVRQGAHKPRLCTTRGGTPFRHEFDADSSGPFGRDLPGGWLTSRQLLRRCAWMMLKYRLIGDDRFPGAWMRRIPLLRRLSDLAGWYDIHAAREA